MELALSDQETAFQVEVRRFLDDTMTDAIRECGRLTGGVFSDFAVSRRWHEVLADKGWIAPAWPKEYGGPGWSVMQRYIWDTECSRAGAPSLFSMGIRMVGPVLMAFGRQDQKDHYLPRILSGQDTWCQGYSEPGAGSDLAALQCRAIRDGNDYIVNGTKIWTTGAQYANAMFCLVRTSSGAKPQQGISFILIDMATPGITIEPIITMAGDHEVNQVFFDDVAVPVANRLGEENQGWTVAKYLLEFERGGAGYAPRLQSALTRLRRIAEIERGAEGRALIEEPRFRLRLAAAETEATALEITEKRVNSALNSGQNPGPASSMFKLKGSETLQQISELSVEALGYYAAPFQPEARLPGNNVAPIGPDHGVTLVPKMLNNRAATIYAGSSEVQRNIIAKLVLGL